MEEENVQKTATEEQENVDLHTYAEEPYKLTHTSQFEVEGASVVITTTIEPKSSRDGMQKAAPPRYVFGTKK